MPPSELVTPSLAVIAVITVVAGVIRGFTGFGSVLVMAPLISIFLGPAPTVAMIMILEICVAVQLLPRALRHTDWRLVGLLVAGALVTAPFGVQLLVHLDQDVMRRALGAIVVIWAAAMLAGVRYTGGVSDPATIGVGAASGALMGVTGIGGPPIVLYLLSTPARAETNRANTITFFAVMAAYLIGVLLYHGVYSEITLWRAAVTVPFFLAGAWLGSRLFDRSSERLYRRIALFFITAVGITALIA